VAEMRWEDKREEWVKMAEYWKDHKWEMYKVIWKEELFLRRMERNRKVRVIGYRFWNDESVGYVQIAGKGDREVKRQVAEKFVLSLIKLGLLKHFLKFSGEVEKCSNWKNEWEEFLFIHDDETCGCGVKWGQLK
jgi:hypothetical protein